MKMNGTLRKRGKWSISEARSDGGDKPVETRMQSSTAGTAEGGTWSKLLDNEATTETIEPASASASEIIIFTVLRSCYEARKVKP